MCRAHSEPRAEHVARQDGDEERAPTARVVKRPGFPASDERRDQDGEADRQVDGDRDLDRQGEERDEDRKPQLAAADSKQSRDRADDRAQGRSDHARQDSQRRHAAVILPTGHEPRGIAPLQAGMT